MTGEPPRVGVVGAGVTGLVLTHYLADRGVDSVAFEADDEPGGVLDSRTVDGRVLECGPQRLRLTAEIEAMVDDLGLRDELVEADDDAPLYVYADGRLRVVPRSPRQFLATDLLSWGAKLRILAEPLTGDARPDETAAELFVRKFGRETYENLISPIFGGTYGSDPAEMPVRHALSSALRMEEEHGNLLVPVVKRVALGGETPPPASFEGGIQRLPEALATAHGDRVRLDAPVTGIRDDGDGYRLETASGEGERFDRVVVTASAPAAATLLADRSPDSADALRDLRYNPLVLVHLHSDVDAEGFGYQVKRSEPLRTLGVTWNASLFDRDGVYTAFLGGMHDPDAIDRSEEALGDVAVEEFERVMDAEAEALRVTKLPDAFPAWDRTWDALDRVDLPEGLTLATNYTSRMGIPSRVREAKRLAGELAEKR